MAGDDETSLRIDRTDAGEGAFREGETAYLRYTLDYEGIPFLDDLGGGWVSGQGPGWVLHFRSGPEAEATEVEFFPGIALVDEAGARRAARQFLSGRGSDA